MSSELRYAVRSLKNAPGFTLTAVAVLALGIGANTAIFSVVNSILLHPPGVQDPGRVAVLRVRYNKLNLKSIGVSTPDFDDVHTQRAIFQAAAFAGPASFNYLAGGQPMRLDAARVSWEWFNVFGARPALGRTFSADEDYPDRNGVAVLEHAAWQRLFGGDASVIGRTLILDRKPYRVIGVMPAGFDPVFKCDLWVPFALPPAEHAPDNRFNEGLFAVARIRPGVPFEKANAAVNLAARRLRNDTGRAGEYARDSDWGMFLVPYVEFTAGELRTPLLVLVGAVAFVLLIACSNIAGLLLARGSSRTREIAVRAALGAGRWHIIRQLLAETVVLATVGGLAGVGLAWLLVRAMILLAPRQQATGLAVAMDPWVLLFALAASALAALLFGLLPTLQIARFDYHSALKEGGRTGTTGRSRQRARQLLIASEFAIALVLTAGAGLLLRSFERLQSVRPGFEPHGVMSAMAALPDEDEKNEDRLIAFHRAVLDRLRSAPGVRAAAAVVAMPFTGMDWSASFNIEGRPTGPGDPGPHGDVGFVSPDYFTTMGIPLREGRVFTDLDRNVSEPVAVIDDVLARQYWPNQDPVGRRMRRGSGGPWWRIVGIVGHVRRDSLAGDSNKGVYYQPMWQRPMTFAHYVAKADSGDGSQLGGAIRQAVRGVNPSQAVFDLKTMDERVAESLGARRFALTVLGAFAVMALLLAAIGIYGVINFSVTQRTQEIGIRMALGAERVAVLRLVLVEGLALAAWGAGVGLVAAAALVRLMKSQLFGVSAFDPVTFAATVAVLALVALLACYVPAYRAMRVDPMVALRYE
ncbi:MAG: ABC transporter permease [Bryobacteraceae bacterium]|jgi:predicted permease